jgi:hypothetical protein
MFFDFHSIAFLLISAILMLLSELDKFELYPFIRFILIILISSHRLLTFNPLNSLSQHHAHVIAQYKHF